MVNFTMTTIEIVRELDAFIPFMENSLNISNWKLFVNIYFENYQLQMEVKAVIFFFQGKAETRKKILPVLFKQLNIELFTFTIRNS